MNKLREALEEIVKGIDILLESDDPYDKAYAVRNIANNALQAYDEQWPSDEEIAAGYDAWLVSWRGPISGNRAWKECTKWLKERMRGNNNERAQ